MSLHRPVGWALLLTLLFPTLGHAHLNSPHIYLEESAGPYPLILIAHLPPAVPGEAELQVRLQDLSAGDDVEVLVREIPPQGEKHAPDWIQARPSPFDPNFFTAPIPLMVYGLWYAEVKVQGLRGEGTIRIPIPARHPVPRSMNTGLTVVLILLTLLLFVTFWQVMGALGRDTHRTEDQPLQESDRARGPLWAGIGVLGFGVFVAFTLFSWYRFDTISELRAVPKLSCELTVMNPPAVAGKPLTLQIHVRDADGEPIDDLAPDHGKMAHVIVVKKPEASYFLHVHPRMTAPSTFSLVFTPPDEGTYKFFSDLLHTTGEGETVTALLEVSGGGPAGDYTFQDPDDSHSFQPSIGELAVGHREAPVGDDLVLSWIAPEAGSLKKGEFLKLTFELRRAGGGTVDSLERYMGTGGRLLILRHDFDVFAHVQPIGTLSGRMNMPMEPAVSPGVSFPFGFPHAGHYRLWAQVKYRGRIYTGAFDARVD